MNRYDFTSLPKQPNYLLPGYTWWLKKEYRSADMLKVCPYKVRIVGHTKSPFNTKYIDCIQWFRGRKKPWKERVGEDFFEGYAHE